MKARLAAVLVVVAAMSAVGCVERRMLIRSEPAGAPVWLDTVPIGETPLEHSFAHYGARLVRVGPIRDENGKIRYMEQERVVDIEPPWYEKFPIDFFFEVIYPKRLVDEHELPTFVLTSVEERAEGTADERLRQVRDEGLKFRERALYSIPEESAEQ